MAGNGYGLIARLNNQQLDERNRLAEQQRTGALPPSDPYAGLADQLSSYVRTCFQQAKDARTQVETEMLESLRQREGIYSPDRLAEIRRQGGSELYMMLTNNKCRAAEAWIRDVIFQPGERPFYAKPTPVSDLPPELMDQLAQMVTAEAQEAIGAGLYVTEREVFERGQEVGRQVKERMEQEAKRRAQLMEDRIDDAFLEGGFYDALECMIPDLVALHCGVLKGPVIRNKRKLKWVRDPRTGKSVPQAADELTPCYYAPSPLDMYPSADSRGPDDGFLIERIPVRRKALHSMIGVPGYKEEAIRAALAEYQKGYTLEVGIDQQRREIEGARNWQLAPDKAIDVLEFHGSVPGEWLIEWGLERERVPDPDADYEVTCWLVGRFVVRCVLNEDPLRRRPYMTAHYDRINGSFWGRGLPRMIRDIQDICNAAARALVNNMAFASGPMLEAEMDRMADGEDPTVIYPWRVFQTKASNTTPSPAIRPFKVDSNANELMGVYQFYSQLADAYSGVQSFEHGQNQRSGAAGTASGLSMLFNAGSRLVKRVVASIDKAICGAVERTHTHIMLHSVEDFAKGDIEVEARGASALLVKETQQMRLVEFMQMTANPMDAQIIGAEGRAELLREATKALAIDADKVVPSEDKMRAQMQMAQMQAMAAAGGAPPAREPEDRTQNPPPRNLTPAGDDSGGLNVVA